MKKVLYPIQQLLVWLMAKNWNLLNNTDILCTLILRLPMSNGIKLNRRVLLTRKNHLGEPGLANFIKVPDKKYDLANKPL